MILKKNNVFLPTVFIRVKEVVLVYDRFGPMHQNLGLGLKISNFKCNPLSSGTSLLILKNSAVFGGLYVNMSKKWWCLKINQLPKFEKDKLPFFTRLI